MERLYAPWRTSYAKSIASSKKAKTLAKDCVFCIALKDNDDKKSFIIKRYKHTIIMLNRYPYNAGHLLIIPRAHKKNLHELTAAARAELMELISHATHIVQTKLKSQGINIGLNLGKVAAAGIPSHLHFHVLPRWKGDTNFLPLLAETKQISFDLHSVYKELCDHF